MVSSFIEYLNQLWVYGVETALTAVAFELVSLEPLAVVHFFFLPFLGLTFLGFGFGLGYFIYHLIRRPPSADQLRLVSTSALAKRDTAELTRCSTRAPSLPTSSRMPPEISISPEPAVSASTASSPAPTFLRLLWLPPHARHREPRDLLR